MWIQALLLAAILAATACSVYFSFKARRQSSRKQYGLYAAKTNISMGVLLIVAAVSLLFLFTDTVARRTIGTIFFVIGLFNLFAGIRNYGLFSRLPENDGGETGGR